MRYQELTTVEQKGKRVKKRSSREEKDCVKGEERGEDSVFISERRWRLYKGNREELWVTSTVLYVKEN